MLRQVAESLALKALAAPPKTADEPPTVPKLPPSNEVETPEEKHARKGCDVGTLRELTRVAGEARGAAWGPEVGCVASPEQQGRQAAASRSGSTYEGHRDTPPGQPLLLGLTLINLDHGRSQNRSSLPFPHISL